SKEVLSFVLDTGSGMCVVSEETAKRLGLRPVARGGLARAVGGGGRFEIVYGFLKSLEVGEARLDNVPVYIRHFYDDGQGADGYIGLAIINKYLATLDYGLYTLSLRRQGEGAEAARLAASTALEIPIRTTSSGFLSGEVRLEGVKNPLNFIVDTGASISVISEAVAAREELSGFLQDQRMRVYGAAGVTDDVKTMLLPRVTFGPAAREKIPAAVLDLEPVNETAGFVQHGIIGGNYLRHYRIVFDFQRGVVRLEQLAPAKEGEGAVPEGEARNSSTRP
ncbi:MAG TPA: aspartyl protease family protein, partial [Pyrinomonadaceae bacterium]